MVNHGDNSTIRRTDGSDGMTDLLKQYSKRFDEFLLQCFEPYGITMENAANYSDRIYTEIYPDVEHGTTYQRCFLDGVYLFTIVIGSEWIESDGGYRFEQTYECVNEHLDSRDKHMFCYGN